MKCTNCSKKIPMHLKVMFLCKCDGIYCTACKQNHKCSFEYVHKEPHTKDTKNGNLTDRV